MDFDFVTWSIWLVGFVIWIVWVISTLKEIVVLIRKQRARLNHTEPSTSQSTEHL